MATIQQLIDQSQDAPPDISKTNWLDTDPTIGLVEAQNAQIDRNIKDAEGFFQQKIDIYNAAHSQKMKNIDKLIGFIPSAVGIYQNHKELENDMDIFREWKKRGQKYEQTDKELDAIDVTAEDINAEYNVGLNAEAGKLEAHGGPSFARNVALMSTLDSDELNVKNKLERYGAFAPAMLAQGLSSLTLADGRTWQDMVTPDDANNFLLEVGGVIFSSMRSKHPEITEREFRKYWLKKYQTAEKAVIAQWSDAQLRLTDDTLTKGRQQKIYNSLTGGTVANALESSFGKNGFIKQRAAYYEQKHPGQGWKKSRDEWRDDLIEGLEKGNVTLPSELNENNEAIDFLSAPFKWNDGSVMSFDKKFPIDANKIRAAALRGQRRESESRQDLIKEEQDNWIHEEYYNYEGERTRAWVDDLDRRYKKRFQTTESPEVIKKAWTNTFELDEDKFDRLQHIYNIGGVVTQQDISSIQNPALKEKAIKFVNETTVAGVPKQLHAEEMELLKAVVKDKMFYKDLNQVESPKFKAVHMQARKDWVLKFNELKAQNQPDSVAASEARKYVHQRIDDGDYNSLPAYTYDHGAANDLSIARTALIVDPEGVASSRLLKNEEKYLDIGEKYIKSNYKRGYIPTYYRELSKLFPNLDPHDLMMNRLIATGRVKEDKDRYESVENPRDFTDKPTSSKVYRNALTTENFDWITENIANPAYKANGGFDAVTRNGKFVELETPLSELTIGEVLNMTDKYDSFGMYNITNHGLKLILQSPDLPFELDDLFDEDTQKALVLGRLKQKANRGHVLNGMPGFKRIVNIPKEDQNKFYEIVGELPPMNQLGNLLPGVAKALVEDTLQ